MAPSNTRRLLASSETSYVSSVSDNLEVSIVASLRLAELLEDELSPATVATQEQAPPLPPSELGRMLSINSVISTASSSAAQQQQASESTILNLDKIGAGTCGVVFAKTGSDLAFKLAKHTTTALTGDLQNDYKMHKKVISAFQSNGNGADFPRIPTFHAYISGSESDWWNENDDFSAAAKKHNIETPCNTLCTERISPLPLCIRTRLIEEFCPERLRSRAHQDTSNKDCLVRPYLGARKPADGPRKMFFSLRNYKLHLNQMVDLGMDIRSLARAMAGALAILHWRARIDAKDVEFVLGSSSRSNAGARLLTKYEKDLNDMSDASDTDEEEVLYDGPQSKKILQWHQRTTDLWLLDFNLCSKITMDDAGAEMAAKAWKINDPYYPKPLQDHTIDRELWNAFVSRYIEVSDQILQQKPTLAELPRKFVASIIRIQQERKEGMA